MTLIPTDPVALTQALIRCESVTPHEGGALTLLQNVLEPAGFTCHRLIFSEPGTPDVDNLYARLGSGRPHLSFAGHTDVVPAGNEAAWTVPPFSGEIRDGALYGRGAVDMKGCIAAFVAAALKYLHHYGKLPRGSLSFLITGDEEGPSINGTMKMLDWLKARDEVIDACLVGEPSNPKALGDEIRIGRRGSLNADLVVHGKQGHSAYPQIADNPVPKLARIIDRLATSKLDDGTANFQPSNLQVTVISVPNTASNVIPGHAVAKLNIRYNDAWTQALDREMGPRHGSARRCRAGCQIRSGVLRHRRRFRDEARPARHDAQRRDQIRYRPRAGSDDRRRHIGRALHQGHLPRRRVRPRQRHDPSGRRAHERRRSRDADRHLRPLHLQLFCEWLRACHSIHVILGRAPGRRA